MVFRGTYVHGMEVQVKHVLVVDSRQACVPLFLHVLPDIDPFE